MEKKSTERDQVALVASCQGTVLFDSSDMLDDMTRGKKTLGYKATIASCLCRRGEVDMNMSDSAKTPRQLSVISSLSLSLATRIGVIVTLMVLIISCASESNNQQDLFCPRIACKCDLQNLEVQCHGPFGASSVPHILNPLTRRMIINHAQVSQMASMDVLPYKELEILDLSFNKLTTLDLDSINQNTRLMTLNVSHNSIVDLKDSALSNIISRLGDDEQPFKEIDNKNEPDELRKYRRAKISIMELDLSHNQITTVKDYLFMRWHKLQRLDLSYNAITVLYPESLVGLNKLEHINLRGNKLSAADAFVLQGLMRVVNTHASAYDGTVSMLRTLDLSENPLQSVEGNSFASLGKAEMIRLDSCSIRTIHDQAFEGLPSLTTLSLSNNALPSVPTEALNTLGGSLKSLDMSMNPMQQIHPYALKNLYYLEELYLNNGSLQELVAHALNGLSSLKKLDLSHNANLSRIHSSVFDNLPKLTLMNLNACPLLTSLLATEDIANHALTILDLRYNPLTCDCDLKWLTNQLKKLNETVASVQQNRAIVSHLDSQVRLAILNQTLTNELLSITCAYPPALAGKPVIDLPDNKLECIKPSSPLNIQIGFASLFIMILALTTVCVINFYHNEKHLIAKLKENIVQNRISMTTPPYTQDLPKSSVDNNATSETQLECVQYEPIDYGPIYTVPTDDQYMTSSLSQQQHTQQL